MIFETKLNYGHRLKDKIYYDWAFQLFENKDEAKTTICNKCEERIDKTKMNDHVDQHCLYSIINCNPCKTTYIRKNYKDHERTCGNTIIKCPKCRKEMKRKDLKQHQLTCGPIIMHNKNEWRCPYCTTVYTIDPQRSFMKCTKTNCNYYYTSSPIWRQEILKNASTIINNNNNNNNNNSNNNNNNNNNNNDNNNINENDNIQAENEDDDINNNNKNNDLNDNNDELIYTNYKVDGLIRRDTTMIFEIMIKEQGINEKVVNVLKQFLQQHQINMIFKLANMKQRNFIELYSKEMRVCSAEAQDMIKYIQQSINILYMEKGL